MRRSTPPALLACAMLMTACAGRTLPSAAPRIQMPQAAQTPCALYRLPVAPTNADLEMGYATRGAQIVASAAARAMVVLLFVVVFCLGAQKMWLVFFFVCCVCC